MKYTSYKSTVEELHRSYKKYSSTNKKARKKISLKEALRTRLEEDPSFIVNGILGRKIVTEWNWLLSDKLMIFPKDEAICRSIFHGKYDVEFIQGITPFAEKFVVNFPKFLELEGITPPSIMVGFYQGQQYSECKIQPILDDLGIPDLEEYVIKDAQDDLHLEVFFKLYDESNKKWATHRFFSPWIDLAGILKAENVNIYRNSGSEFTLGDEVETTDTEDNLQFIIVKFIVSLLVYAQATGNDCFRDGLPSLHTSNREIDDAFRRAKFKALELASSTLSESAYSSVSSSHYRSWHIRQLRDDRYYQNEYKDLQPGSRLVFVKDSFINRDVSPKTVVEV